MNSNLYTEYYNSFSNDNEYNHQDQSNWEMRNTSVRGLNVFCTIEDAIMIALNTATWSSNTLASSWASNNFSNFVTPSGVNNWNWASNTSASNNANLALHGLGWTWASNTSQLLSARSTWTSNNFSNTVFANEKSNWVWASNVALWDSNNFSNVAMANGQSNWNFASNTSVWGSNAAVWSSNNYSNMVVAMGFSNWNWASNVSRWNSNSTSNFAFSNGQSNWNWASNVTSYTSNFFSNFAFFSGVSNWNWASNAVRWVSNNSINYATSKGESNWNYASNMIQYTINNFSNYNNGVWNSNNFSNYALSNRQGEWASNTASFASNHLEYASNVAAWTSNETSKWIWASNVGYWCSNTFSNLALSNNQSNWNWASNVGYWCSNNISNCTFASNVVSWCSNRQSNYVLSNGVLENTSNDATWASNNTFWKLDPTNTLYYNNAVGIGVSATAYQLELSTDKAAKLTTSTWTVTSDQRLKEDIELANIDLCYSNLKRLPLMYYKWKDTAIPENIVPDRHKLGWLAQDVEHIFCKSVMTQDKHGLTDCRTLNTDQIYAMMYGSMQKLQMMVEALEKENTKLKQQFKKLLKQL
jgi:hypothetical protein